MKRLAKRLWQSDDFLGVSGGSGCGHEHHRCANDNGRPSSSTRARQRFVATRWHHDNDDDDDDLISFSQVGASRDKHDGSFDYDGDAYDDHDARPEHGSLSHFFFGFLYDSDDNDNDYPDDIHDAGGGAGVDDDGVLDELLVVDSDTGYVVASSCERHCHWTRHLNALNLSLFAALFLTSLASVVPVTLVPVMATLPQFASDETSFAPQAAAAAVLGTALGKILNGPVGDLCGARQTTLVYTGLLVVSLLCLASAQSPSQALAACFLVEFTSSVQWPCCIIILATHYTSNTTTGMRQDKMRGNNAADYEGAIYVTSLASRMGSLFGIPASSILLRVVHWRVLALLGAWMALVGASLVYLYLWDSPHAQHKPQNPVDPALLQKWFPEYFRGRQQQRLEQHGDLMDNKSDTNVYDNTRQSPMSISLAMNLLWFVLCRNVIPSVRRLLRSGTFWSVALAHTGASVIRTSERILGTYLADTSNATLTESRAAGLAVCLSVGTFVGLVVAGSMFARRTERQRKWLVSKLYLCTIVACYVLSVLAIPAVRRVVNEPGMVTVFQTLAVVAAGFGIAVQFYHIPSLVGATFGRDKGLFSAYTDGLAYGVASILWRIVGHVVSHGNADGGGWAYGWAAVALLLIPSSLLMVEFMEHFFCRPRHKGSYETIIFA